MLERGLQGTSGTGELVLRRACTIQRVRHLIAPHGPLLGGRAPRAHLGVPAGGMGCAQTGQHYCVRVAPPAIDQMKVPPPPPPAWRRLAVRGVALELFT